MTHHHQPSCGFTSSQNRPHKRTLRSLILGALGVCALASTIAPANAALDLKHYTLSWEGSNGYSMKGNLSVDASVTTPVIDYTQLWDMSVSFYGPGNQLLSTWTQMDDGHQVYEYLTFSFDRQELLVNQMSLDLGWDTGQSPNEFYLYSSEGLELHSVSAGNAVSYGGYVSMKLGEGGSPEEPEEPANTAPTLNLPSSPVVVEATFAGGANVTFSATATDAEDEVAPIVTTNPANGSVFALGDTTVNASTQDSGGLTASGSFVVRVQDTTGPVIELTRNHCSEVLTVGIGTQFNDPGATAYDAVDQSVAVSVAGTVDTNTLGNYTLTYTAVDSRGNAATPVSRTVSVVDPLPGMKARRYSGGNFDAQGDFNVTSKNKCTAALNIAGQTYRGVFTLAAHDQVVALRGPKGTSVNARVWTAVNGAADPVLMVQANSVVVELRPTLYTAAQPAPASVIGTYTAVLRGDGGFEVLGAEPTPEGPIGSGFATFVVARDGRVRTTGRTAEGTAITNSSYLVRPACGTSYSVLSLPEEEEVPPTEIVRPAEFHVYTGLYSAARRGSFGAVFTLDRNAPWGSIGGEFRWTAPAGAAKLYPEGLNVAGYSIGSRFERIVPGKVDLEFTFTNMTPFIASGTVLAHPAFYDMSTTDPERALGLRCRYTLETGVLTGARYRGSAARSYQAIWLQEQGLIEGFSVSGDGKSNGLVRFMNEIPD